MDQKCRSLFDLSLNSMFSSDFSSLNVYLTSVSKFKGDLSECASMVFLCMLFLHLDLHIK